MRKTSVPIAFIALLLSAGCPDPKSRLDDFEDRVVDAGEDIPDEMPDARPIEGGLPDITGEFYVGFRSTLASEPDKTFRFIWKTVLTKNPNGTGTLELTSTAIKVDGTALVPPAIVLAAMQVSAGGEFKAIFDHATIPGAANPVSGGNVVLSMFGQSTIQSEDFFCGVAVEGSQVFSPILFDLQGSTFAAKRVAPGTIGAALPEFEVECREVIMIDAGVPDGGGNADGGVVDAGSADAPSSLIDAGTP
jgi:hypothetical protein